MDFDFFLQFGLLCLGHVWRSIVRTVHCVRHLEKRRSSLTGPACERGVMKALPRTW